MSPSELPPTHPKFSSSMTPQARRLLDLPLAPETRALLAAAPSVTLAGSHEDLIALAVRDAGDDGIHEVAYEVPGKGQVVEANVCQTRNGISANYNEPYMRRRDPDCMVIGDDRPTDKQTYVERFGASFDPVREETFEWLKTQRLAVFAFYAGLPSPATQALVIAGLVALYTVSAISGLSRGIQILSRVNVVLGFVLLLYILVLGPTGFILEGYGKGLGSYLGNFFQMSLFRADGGWLGWWTVFFWGWFLGYGPLMAMFIARVSRGRSIRSIVIMLSIVAPLVTNFWFTIIGGSGIAMDLAEPGSVAGAFEGFNLPAALLAITQQLPLGFLISVLFLALTTIFVATTGDSMTYVISVAMSNEDRPAMAVRVFWGIAMGLMAIILISVGSGGVAKLQSFIVVTAVPVSLVLLPSLWDAVRITLALGRRR